MIDPADLAACRAMLRGGSRSFFAAGRLLPRRVMEPATALYAFCRVADDWVDRGEGPLEALHGRLDRVYAGTPDDAPADRALAAVVKSHQLPRVLLDGLLEGFAWDAEGRQYEDIAALEAYAARVAGTVGAAMSLLMGERDANVVARACDLGLAMQLSNIARDVGEDARAGRLYLPRGWLREAGVDPDAFLAAPRFSPAVGAVVCRLVRHAEPFYARADAGIGALPFDCRPGIGAARRLYAAIGHSVAARGGNSVDRRAVVPTAVKLGLLGRSIVAAVDRRGDTSGAAAPAVRYLVAAVAESARPVRGDGRLAWLLSLFAALNERQALAGRGGR